MSNQNEVKKIKKERRELFAILGDTFTEHIPLDADHEIGTDANCELCERHNLVSKVLQNQEVFLEKGKKMSFYSKNTRNNKVHYMTVEKSPTKLYIVGTNLQKAVKEAYPTSKVRVIQPADYPDVFIETKQDVFVSLETIHSERRLGIIAKMGMSRYSSHCQRKVQDRFIRYTGENLQEIIDFCSPFIAHKTKKNNKVAVMTSRGSFSISEGEVIVKNPFGNLEFYSREEFAYLFEVKGEFVWRQN